MNNQATKNLSLPVSTPTKSETEKHKTNLGKRKNSKTWDGNSDCSDDLDSAFMQRKKYEPSIGASDDLDPVIMSEPRKKIQKLTHSNTIERESVEKMKSELMRQPTYVQTKMACVCGRYHTITLSNDGIAHSFGRNDEGQLGLGHYNNVSLPTPIPNLPQINQISCGLYFTVCVDDEGFIWSFGENDYGQLGTGDKRYYFNIPQKILEIPPVISVSCGYAHTLIITNDDNLWSCGRNDDGQLFHGDTKDRSKPQKTSFSNISKISTGWSHSLFQNNNREIFSCGYNKDGACGLGQFNALQITPSLIHNTPSNIVHFVCGTFHSLFLDSEGNVFSVGCNEYGQLGLGHNTNQNVLSQIPNIPPIKTISCVGSSCYLIDFEGNFWSFGYNDAGQLGHGDKTDINTPKVINTLKDIQQISYGSNGHHFLAKNSQNQIFVTGNNRYRQLGTSNTQSVSIPKEINSQYSTIWRDEFFSRAKSARK